MHSPTSSPPKLNLRTDLVFAPLLTTDWILSIILVGLIGGLTDKAGYKREFSLTDTSIQHIYAVSERITFGECIIYSGVIPAILIIITAVLWRRSFWDLHNGLLGL